MCNKLLRPQQISLTSLQSTSNRKPNLTLAQPPCHIFYKTTTLTKGIFLPPSITVHHFRARKYMAILVLPFHNFAPWPRSYSLNDTVTMSRHLARTRTYSPHYYKVVGWSGVWRHNVHSNFVKFDQLFYKSWKWGTQTRARTPTTQTQTVMCFNTPTLSLLQIQSRLKIVKKGCALTACCS